MKTKLSKKITAVAAIALGLAISMPASAQKKPVAKASAQQADVVKGGLLISKADCLTCHKPTVKLIGPSFKEIAQKYKPTDKNYAMLVEKVIKGGSGNWGAVPMSPHSDLKAADVKKMVTYILATK